MCGIVGFILNEDARSRPQALDLWQLLLTSLRRLEYRGYDSWGVAGITAGGRGEGGAPPELRMYRESGRITADSSPGQIASVPIIRGIAHTRWATHGAPIERNAHPHLNTDGSLAIIHNGIIENDAELRRYLTQRGVTFRSDTDSELFAHLISHFDRGDLIDALRQALAMVEGAYGLGVISRRHPDLILGARRGSPLLVGEGPDGVMMASDPNAMIATGGQFVPLDDGEIVILTPDAYRIERLKDRAHIERKIEQIELLEDQLHSGGYPSFMAKEIHEQPQAIENCLRGRLDFNHGTVRLLGADITAREARDLQNVVLVGCGTSWHAAQVGRLLIEELAGIPCSVDYSAEFRYRNPVLPEKTLVVALSQSGETADTLAALVEAKRRGAALLGIVNVVGSSIARECGRGIYIHAGPEIGVASTKAFTCQLTALAQLAILLGRHRNMSQREGLDYLNALKAIPEQVNSLLEATGPIRELAESLSQHKNFLYIGRGPQFPVALEGALKLKEISYRHAEGIPAAELKHGPIALVDEKMPVVVLAPEGRILPKMISNVQEIKARNGRLLGIVTRDNHSLDDLLDWRIEVQSSLELLEPILTVLPLQVLAHDLALHLGRDVDRPRNLAKSVTVE